MMNIDFTKENGKQVKQITLADDTKEIRKIYKSSFPRNERVKFKSLFTGVFSDFKMYGFYNEEGKLMALAHLFEADEYIHLNYLAVDKVYRSMGVGSNIIKWINYKFNHKPIVADVENFDNAAKNNNQRALRLRFYYKNGFTDGKVEFEWEGTNMFYIQTGEVPCDLFMRHLLVCFPTIKNIRKHKDSHKAVENYFNNKN